jgi:uncharacterized membrane protein YkvA (DUF1232 family)
MNLKERAKKLKTDIPAVYIALKKKETPLIAKILAGITVGYALSPIDLIPDFIPVLGYLDDLIILPILIFLTIKTIPKELFAECQKEAENFWVNTKHKRWYFAVPIILFWMIVAFLIIKIVFH